LSNRKPHTLLKGSVVALMILLHRSVHKDNIYIVALHHQTGKNHDWRKARL